MYIALILSVLLETTVAKYVYKSRSFNVSNWKNKTENGNKLSSKIAACNLKTELRAHSASANKET